MHEKCCKNMKYQFIKKGHTVFFAGDSSYKGNFYIIIDGAVNVLIPKKQEDIIKESKLLK